MRRLLPLVLVAITACSSGFLAGNRSKESREAAPRSGERSTESIEEFERFDRPDAAAAFWAMKRGITPGMDVAARYAAANAQVDRMGTYSTVAGQLVSGDRAAGRPAAAESVSRRTILSSWTFLGPGNIGGRTRALLFDPSDPNVLYTGAVSGGVWKSTNGGASWTPIGDVLVNLAVSSMAMDPKDGSTIYAGTGEGYFREDVRGTALPLRGDGIFVTHDGGTSWQQLAATASNPDFQWVNDLVISPHDSRRIYAATRTGVWRSLDAGATWTNVLPTIVKGGALDLVVRGDTDGDYLFASCGVFEQATVYRNQHPESDGDWTAVLSEPGMSRTSLAIAPSNPSIVYALSASNTPAPDKSTQNLLAVFRSDQNGDPGTWTAQVRVTDPDKLNALILSNPISALSSQCAGSAGVGNWVPMGWHCNVISVDPTNPDRVWAAGVDLFRSDDAGKTWGVASYWWTDNNNPAFVHADQHVIAFHPKYDGISNQTIFVANDGGIYRTDNANAAVGRGTDGGCRVASAVRWTPLVNSYGSTQFYHGAVSPDGRRFAGGAQDNGTSVGDIDGGINQWQRVWSGDGAYSAFDPVDPSILFAESQNAGLGWVNLTTNESRYVRVSNPGSEHYLFIAPFTLDPNLHTRLWLGGDQMWRCDDPATAGNCTQASTLLSSTISAIAVEPGNSAHIIAGTNDGTILATTEALTATASTAWQTRVPRSGFVSSIAYDPFVSGVVYATYAGFGGAHVWRSRDNGITWTAIDGTDAAMLPDIPAHSIAPDPTQPGRLYLGTDLGIFVSLDGGDHWMSEDSGLPRVVTEWVTIASGAYGPAVYAFTHGRGVWRAELMAPPPRRRATRR